MIEFLPEIVGNLVGIGATEETCDHPRPRLAHLNREPTIPA
jgi:hypothetical protein